MKIVSILAHEQNDCANSQTCHNGGGYFQPIYTIVLDNGATVVISDTSCGEFGSRISVSYINGDGNQSMEAYYGSMIPYREWKSDIPEGEEWLSLVEEELGYKIYTYEAYMEDVRFEEEKYEEEYWDEE